MEPTSGGVVVAFKNGRQRLLDATDAITEGQASGLSQVRLRLKEAYRAQATEEYRPLLEQYLALNDDHAPVVADSQVLGIAIRRVVSGKGPLQPASELEARVMECQKRLVASDWTPEEATRREKMAELHRLTSAVVRNIEEFETEPRRLPMDKVGNAMPSAEAFLEAMGPGPATYPKGVLDRSPKANWVEKAGGLPRYIERIASHIHFEKGMPISRAIAIAVNAVKKMCAAGDTNLPGVQQVNAGSRAEACKAVAEWEKKKASTHTEGAMEEAMSRTTTVYEPFEPAPIERTQPRRERVVADPLASSGAISHDNAQVRFLQEGQQLAVPESTVVPNTHLDIETLRDSARELYESTGGATPQGRAHIRSAGRTELSRIVRTLADLTLERMSEAN